MKSANTLRSFALVSGSSQIGTSGNQPAATAASCAALVAAVFGTIAKLTPRAMNFAIASRVICPVGW